MPHLRQALRFDNYPSCPWKPSKHKFKFAWISTVKEIFMFCLPLLVLRFWPGRCFTIFVNSSVLFIFYQVFSTVGLNNLACYILEKGNEHHFFFFFFISTWTEFFFLTWGLCVDLQASTNSPEIVHNILCFWNFSGKKSIDFISLSKVFMTDPPNPIWELLLWSSIST